jgi:Na+-transporting methylmalonyl-CoA/oxaloacetate decarboxylase gamma subunit
MDSLLDTMANVVGILVVLVAVMQLAVGDAVDRIVEEGVRQPASLPEVEAAERDQATVAEAVVAARGKLEALPPGPEKPGILSKEATPLLEALRALPGSELGYEQGVEAVQEKVQRKTDAVENLRAELVEQDTRLARLDALLTHAPPEDRPKLARLPDPRPPAQGAEEIVVFCRYGHVAPVDRRQMLKRLHGGVEKALGENRAPTPSDGPWLQNFFRKQSVGWENFYWSIRNAGPRVLFADMAWHNRDFGERAGELRIEGSRLERIFDSHDPQKEYIRFWVWSDSFEVYLEARYLAEAAGFDVAWTAVPVGEEVGSNLLGSSRTRVMID